MMKTLAQALTAVNAVSLKNVHARVAAVELNEVPRLLSQLMVIPAEPRLAWSAPATPEGVAVLAITYPAVDAGNHKSLNALVAQLTQHGMADTAALLDSQLPYLLLNDPAKALRVYHEILKDSAAIGVTLYYAGASGQDALAMLEARLPKGE